MLDWPIWEWALLLVASGSVAWAVSKVWGWALRFLWSSGFDERYRLAHTIAPLRFGLGLGVLGISLGPFRIYESTTSAFVTVAIIAVIAMVGLNFFRDMLGGIALAVRRPFTIDDPLSVPGISGRVVDIGLTRVRLLTPDGRVVDLPTRELSTDRLETSQGSRRSLPIMVRVHFSESADINTAVDEMRDQTLMSCFVDAGAPVIVEVLDERTVSVRATPIHPDDSDELRSDITARAWTLGRNAGNEG